MVAKWGLFLCDCHQTLSIDAQQLDLPTPYVQCASHPDTDVQPFATLAQRERLDHVCIACCASPTLFDEALGRAGARAPHIHYVNLKESCFWVHPDASQAHAKATRLLQAAMRSAEAQTEPAYNPLTVGGRVLIATDGPQGIQLAEQLRGVAQPLCVAAPDFSDFDTTLRVYSGRIVEVQGRLGDFHVMIDEMAAPGALPRELQADQVVIISHHDTPAVTPRTGCYVLLQPSIQELDSLNERIREHIGDFLKTIHIRYHADICAGGAADQEACGRCIPACPYTAIRRDGQNHLRIQVDHMACEGCGACVSACPTSALQFVDPSPNEIYARLGALLAPQADINDQGRPVVLFHCSEQGRRVLEEAGRRALSYPAHVLPVEVPCLRYVSAANMLAAFRLGAAGVGLLGCATCPHGERELLSQQLDVCRVTLDAFGLGSERLRLITASDGTEEVTVADVGQFADAQAATPIRWDGQPMQHLGNRNVIVETITTFIEQTGQEPGRRRLDGPHPFADAEVRASGCTMCRACVHVCPVHAFKLEESTASLQFKPIACVACGLCEQVCPEHVITLRREVDFTRAALDYQTVVQDEMVACTRCNKPYINRKALEAIESKVLSFESLLDTFAGNRRSLLRMCPDCRAVSAMLEVEKGWEP